MPRVGSRIRRGWRRPLLALRIARGCPRLQWSVLDWNEPAIGFYRAQGAELLPDWRTCRITGDALARMAAAAER